MKYKLDVIFYRKHNPSVKIKLFLLSKIDLSQIKVDTNH